MTELLRVGDEFLVNTATLGSQNEPTVTALSNGGFVVSWADQSGGGVEAGSVGVKAQVYSATGVRVGDEFVVATSTQSTQYQPTIAGLSDGGFVVSWADGSGQGGDPDASIKAQVFSAAGGRIGGEFLVNTVTAGMQQRPTITGLSDGGFVVSWQDSSGQGGDASGSGIKAQLFSAAGERIGAEVLVNTATLNNQGQPTVTGLSQGGFVVSWTDLSGQGAMRVLQASRRRSSRSQRRIKRLWALTPG